jgi:phosphocarrier protein HPr
MAAARSGWPRTCFEATSREYQPAHRRRHQTMTSRAVDVVNRLGVHARAAAKFVHLASRFDSRIRVSRDGREMDGKSILGILLLAAARGTTITILADGPDEQAALTALVALVESGFDEGSCVD